MYSQSVPRVRGDGPAYSGAAFGVFLCSPRARGWTDAEIGKGRNGQTCSPRARGWTSQRLVEGAGTGVFPACAGMDRLNWLVFDACRQCSPRARGWTGSCVCCREDAETCSPRARGWTDGRRLAGGNRLRVPRVRGDGPIEIRRNPLARARVPRVRGDGPAIRADGFHPMARVPRVRGDGPEIFAMLGYRDGVFPACAGMDR